MKDYRRREILKFGAALPLAMQSIDLRAEGETTTSTRPRRVMFICNSLGFYGAEFFPADAR